ncbi:hypothetical protein OG782_32515 [Streptomyces sp. NBC_00876]|uniref:hypothetical protein n=1 Tax=Streptomyces sp. NBC_00876 TaxID=2975853 RepID=UPI00386C99A1|nr:hypothetical protein OG782_32515 [Streptomyces sp. NBC_00876]
MNWLSARTDRLRSTRASVLLGWVLVLLAMVSCCSLTSAQPMSARPSSPHHATASPAAGRAATPTPAAAARIVVADAPGDRGIGSSCHGASEHSAPVVLPGQPAPAALPCATAALPPGPLTGAAAIRGPSNDAVGDVDRLRLQVQRI